MEAGVKQPLSRMKNVATGGADAKGSEKATDHNWELVKTVLIALVLSLLFRSLAYEPFHIPSGSMKSTLLIGDYLWVSKFEYGYSRYSFPFGIQFFDGRVMGEEPERGDVVVFRPPSHPHVDYIKRVIGLPGDRIQVIEGKLIINGFTVPREEVDTFIDQAPDDGATHMLKRYKETLPNGVTYHVLDARQDGRYDNTGVFVVPTGHYFMMGDNRDNSEDSRNLERIGFIPYENLIGPAKSIFFSTDGSARIWEPWKWFSAMRTERIFTSIQ